jgi:hypothetical protein
MIGRTPPKIHSYLAYPVMYSICPGVQIFNLWVAPIVRWYSLAIHIATVTAIVVLLIDCIFQRLTPSGIRMPSHFETVAYTQVALVRIVGRYQVQCDLRNGKTVTIKFIRNADEVADFIRAMSIDHGPFRSNASVSSKP